MVQKAKEESASSSTTDSGESPFRQLNNREWKSYKYKGPLRPFPVTKQMSMPLSIQQPDYAMDGNPISETKSSKIPVYSAEEIAGMREVCRIGREVLDLAGRALKVGVTGEDIDKLVYNACLERNAYPSPLNYRGFPKSVCVSPNEVVCHGIPDTRPLEEGDIVNLDVTVYYKGFHGDLNETYLIGNVDEKSLNLVKTAYECLAEAIKYCKPGMMYRELGTYIHNVAVKNGCSVIKTYCGHGIGQLFHTAPNVPHYKNNKAPGVMAPGHIFTIEPMINAGASGDHLWPDGWTSVTDDGERSAQFEQVILITETGCEILSARPGSSTTEMVWDLDAVQR